MTSSDVTAIFNGTERCAASLRQLSFLLSLLSFH